jgi:hypothetical protein
MNAKTIGMLLDQSGQTVLDLMQAVTKKPDLAAEAAQEMYNAKFNIGS